MRINGIRNIAFQRRFTSNEEKVASELHLQAQAALKHTGHNILICHDTSLPVNPKKDTGIGHLLSKEGLKFIKDMKTYLGINNLELHPQSEYYVSLISKFCSPYSGTALSLGEHLIPLEMLKTKEFGCLLKDADIEKVVNANVSPLKNEIVNIENIINKMDPTSNEKALRTAFERFKRSDNPTLKREFEQFKQLNNDWVEPQGVYRVLLKENRSRLSNWSELDQNLYNPDFDKELRAKRLRLLFATNKDDIEFYKFNQFLAEKTLKSAKSKINKMGIMLTGDCLIGFGDETIFAFPKAFSKDLTVGWGLRALDYDKILDYESDAAKLLRRKVELFAKRYDGIRFDVSWAYLSPALRVPGDKNINHKHLKTDKLLKMIEDTVKEVRVASGVEFNVNTLIHEFEASDKDFPLNYENRELIKKRMKIYSMQYMKDDWGHFEAFEKNMRFSPETLVLGLGNQDALPHAILSTISEVDFTNMSQEEKLKKLSETFGGTPERIEKKGEKFIKELINKYNEFASLRKGQIRILAKKYNVPEEYLTNYPLEFAKYKAAESFNGLNSMFYFMDVLGSKKVFDAQGLNGYENFRYRIPNDYMKKYMDALRNGTAINMFDIYAKRFCALGLDKSQPELYAKIVEYRNILLENKEVKPLNKRILFGVVAGMVVLGAGLFALLGKTKEPINK